MSSKSGQLSGSFLSFPLSFHFLSLILDSTQSDFSFPVVFFVSFPKKTHLHLFNRNLPQEHPSARFFLMPETSCHHMRGRDHLGVLPETTDSSTSTMAIMQDKLQVLTPAGLEISLLQSQKVKKVKKNKQRTPFPFHFPLFPFY